MGRCYGGVNTFSGSGVGPRFACGAGSDPISIAWVGALSFGKEFDPAAGLQAKKIPASAGGDRIPTNELFTVFSKHHSSPERHRRFC